MKKTTLCYIEKDGCYLMLYRNKKNADPNLGKWLGVGGKFENDETPDECLVREVREETGYVLASYHFHGIIEFRNDSCEDEDMYLYTAKIDGAPVAPDCNEGDLHWVPKEKVLELNLWEGDRAFLKPLLEGQERLNMRLEYSGDRLLRVILLD